MARMFSLVFLLACAGDDTGAIRGGQAETGGSFEQQQMMVMHTLVTNLDDMEEEPAETWGLPQGSCKVVTSFEGTIAWYTVLVVPTQYDGQSNQSSSFSVVDGDLLYCASAFEGPITVSWAYLSEP